MNRCSRSRRCSSFDGECGFCRKWAAWLGKRLPAGTLLVAFQQIDNLAAFGLTESEVSTASYWIDADGTAHGGADSFAYALRGTGLPWGPCAALLRAPVSRIGARLAYEVIARNRHRLPAPSLE